MSKDEKNKTIVERLYKTNILPHGNGAGPNYIGPVLQKIDDPPFEDEKSEKSSI